MNARTTLPHPQPDVAAGDGPADTAHAVMPRATIQMIVGKRNHALGLYSEAHDALAHAAAAVETASAAVAELHPGEDRFNHHLYEEKVAFLKPISLPCRDDYMAHARKITDTEVWSGIIRLTELEQLMDRQAKGDLYQQLLTDPPEATVDNIYATLAQFLQDAETIFKRGIANCFSNLDRRFRSHDGFKIGSRVILKRMFDERGYWNYHRDMESTLFDIERTFTILDGRSVCPGYGGIVGQLRHHRSLSHGARQDTVEDTFFKISIYKNGNAHVWFKRDDLVEKVNKLLADYYGEVIPDGMTPEDDGGLFDPKTTLAKNYGFFPTPEAAADRIISQTPLHRDNGARLAVLEPSAGTGNLARRCVATGHAVVDAVEIQPGLADALRAEGLYRCVHACDFLALQPDPQNLYDRVVMNPPFDRERDIDHVMHALDFLGPQGFLIAIMSAGTEFRETRKAVAFRALMHKMRARWQDLPPGSFASVGTYQNTILLRVWKDARSFW